LKNKYWAFFLIGLKGFSKGFTSREALVLFAEHGK